MTIRSHETGELNHSSSYPTSSLDWMPVSLLSGWTWAAMLLSFLLGLIVFAWFSRRWIRIQGALAIAGAYTVIPAFELVVEKMGVEAKLMSQGWDAALVACIAITGLLVLEAYWCRLEYHDEHPPQGKLEDALAELDRRLNGKPPADRVAIINGLLAMSSSGVESAEGDAERLSNALDMLSPEIVASVRSAKEAGK